MKATLLRNAAVATPDQQPPTIVDVLRHISEVEESWDLFALELDGCCVWPLFRPSVSWDLQRLQLSRGSLPSSQNWIAAASDLPSLLWPRRARYAFLTYVSGLMEETHGAYKDVWFDDVLAVSRQSERGRAFKIDTLNSHSFMKRRGSAVVRADLTTSAISILARNASRVPMPRVARRIAERLSRCFRECFGLAQYSPQWVEGTIRSFFWTRKLYRRLLRGVLPELVLVADPGEHAFVAAAHDLGLAVFELQHGLCDRLAYSWPEAAHERRAQLPVPDRLLIYGDYWRDELKRWGYWEDELRAVGSPRLDSYRRSNSERRADRCTIVVTAQGVEEGRLDRFLREFLHIARGRLDVQVVVKLHPIYGTDRALFTAHEEGEDRLVVLAAGQGPSTFELLTKADLHVSISSSCHFDALGLGTPTVILPFATHENVLGLVAAGHASVASTPEELLELARNAKEQHVPTTVSEYYFRSGAVQNIRAEIGLALTQ